MLASLSQAVYLLNAPIAQAARLAGALQAKLEETGQDSIEPLAGGSGADAPAAAEEAPDASEAPADEPPAEEAPAAEPTEAAASDEGDTTEA
jgi:large subunit ribosomal protein L10